MLIRSATADDLPAIQTLERQSKTAAHWGEHEYAALFAPDAPERIALVATDELDTAQLRGFLIARCGLEEWEIESVVVAEGYRRLGIATQLTRELLLQAQAVGSTSVLLEVRQSNLAARRLYEKLGFSQQGIRVNYYRDPLEDALLLHLFVSSGRKVP